MEYLPRLIDERLRTLLGSVPIVTIEGARAAGKTTTATRVVRSELRLPRDLELLRSDPRGVLERLEPPVLIDEWQLAGVEVLWAIKELIDEDSAPGRFVLTGSVQPESYGPTYPLTGRGARLTMYPMTRRELVGRGDQRPWLARLMDGELFVPSPESAPQFDTETLLRSGFPSTIGLDSDEWLRAYAASVAERSVEERRDPTRVLRTLKALATLESTAVPDERIIDAADINRATFVAYDGMLHRAHIATPVSAWHSNRLKRLTTYPKRMLVDAALALVIAGVDGGHLLTDPAVAGRYFESFVAAQLRPEVETLHGALHHLRSKGGEREIDFVVECAGALAAIEVKHVVRPRPDSAKHLRALLDAEGDRFAAAVVVHRGTATFEIVPDVWAIPVATMWPTEDLPQ